jgi:hypothetical protein
LRISEMNPEIGGRVALNCEPRKFQPLSDSIAG